MHLNYEQDLRNIDFWVVNLNHRARFPAFTNLDMNIGYKQSVEEVLVILFNII